MIFKWLSIIVFFDYLNRVKRLKNNENVELLRLSYNNNGARQSINRLGGATTTYAYDSINRLSSFSQNFTGSNYDITNHFKYNPANQIIDIKKSNLTYYYQGNDNKIGSYFVNRLNQYTSIAGIQLSYDDNGNLTSDGEMLYNYDDENRLTSVYGAKVVDFTYDGLGRLYKKNTYGNTTYYLYDGDALVAEYNGNNQITARYIHGDRVDEPWVQFSGAGTSLSNTQFLHADHQGSIIAYSDTYGNIKGTNSYDSYGIAGDNNTGRFGYTGQLYFKELDLNYYKARIYHPKLGRFLQTDPVGYEDQMNLYAYVGNDPVNMVDPTGEFGIIGALIGGGIDAAIQIGNNMKNGQGFGDAVMNVDLGSVAVSAALGAVTGGATTLLKGAATGTTKVAGATVQLTSKTERAVAGSLGASKAAAAGFVQAERKGKGGVQGAAAQVVNGVTSPIPVGTMIMEGAAMLTGSDEQSTPPPKIDEK